MYAIESCTEVLLCVWALCALFRVPRWHSIDKHNYYQPCRGKDSRVMPPEALRFVIYDNACAVVRTIQKRTRNGANWAQLAGLKWVIDRLHFTYHKACQDQSSGWYAPGTNPAEHPELRGIDAEAAEQVFSIANRWQVRGAGCPLLVEAKRQRRRLLLVLLI